VVILRLRNALQAAAARGWSLEQADA